jgi:exoribonuclease-2
VNQRQIIAWARGEEPPHRANSEALLAAMRDFEVTYDAYAEFQRQMERYWCLKWLLQEAVSEVEGAVIRENLVRLARLPVVARVPSVPDLPAGARVRLAVSSVDLVELAVHFEFVGRADAA